MSVISHPYPVSHVHRNSIARSTLLVGILLIFTGLILYRPIVIRSNWSIDVKDTLHWAGIASMVLVSLTTVVALKWFRHKVTNSWLNIHCISTTASAMLAVIHSRTRAGVILPLHYHSYLTLILMILLALSGALIRLYPRSHAVKNYIRVYHMPLSLAFYVTLVYHVLVKLAVI
jgi:hypothetical protein